MGLALYGLIQLISKVKRRLARKLFAPIMAKLSSFFNRKPLTPLTSLKTSASLRLSHNKCFVVIYGACTPIGKLLSKLLYTKHGYSVLLIDSCLSELQNLRAELFETTDIVTGDGQQQIQAARILQVNFSMMGDSTTLEHRLFRLFFDV